VRIVAVTNAPFYHAYRRLSQLHLHHYFDGLVAWTGVKIAPGDHLYSEEFAQKYEKVRKICSSSFGLFKTFEREQSKPNLLPFEMVIRHFGTHRSYFSLGDSLSKDLHSASKLGMQTIWARYGMTVDKKNLETVLFVTPWTENEIRVHNDTNQFSPNYTIDDPIELLGLLPAAQQQLELL
jgi:FMN phosphatase YigB (HAD superfamily)